ncbi:aldehyde dehydrogenase family protein [Acidisoma sp. 7E03]
MSDYAMVIDGSRVVAPESIDIRNPADGSLVGQMPLGNQDALNRAVVAARAAFPCWAAQSSGELAAIIDRLADAIALHSEELALLLTLEQGKPLNGLGSRFELGGAQAWARATAEFDLPVEVLQDTPDGRVELHRKPIGIVGSVTPWNWPVMIACWHIMPALRAGNTLVIKPSSLTPLSTMRLVEIINTVLPPGVVNCVTGPGELGGQMAAHEDINKIVFTGSTRIGRTVMGAAAPTLKRLTLELGGNDAGIVLPDADPAAIAEGLFWGAFINNGQTCAALKRLYVHESLYKDVADALVAIAEGIKVGDGRQEDSVLGPLQNAKQRDLVEDLVEDARRHGGRVVAGGRRTSDQGFFYAPTIVTNVDNGIRLVDEEQFGPALPLVRYRDLDEALARANASEFGLGGSVWSRDVEQAKAVARHLECGTVWINKHGAVQPNAPFGGVKQSGLGIEFGIEGLKEMTTIQTVLV